MSFWFFLCIIFSFRLVLYFIRMCSKEFWIFRILCIWKQSSSGRAYDGVKQVDTMVTKSFLWMQLCIAKLSHPQLKQVNLKRRCREIAQVAISLHREMECKVTTIIACLYKENKSLIVLLCLDLFFIVKPFICKWKVFKNPVRAGEYYWRAWTGIF